MFWSGANFESDPANGYLDLPWDIGGQDFARFTGANTSPSNINKTNTENILANRCLVNLDLEENGWTVDFDFDPNGSMFQQYCQLIDQIRACEPDAIIGSYSVFPNFRLSWKDIFSSSAQANRCLYVDRRNTANLWCDKVGYLAPSMYVPYQDINDSWGSYECWKCAMRLMLREARIGCPNTPIYPFLWRTAYNVGVGGTLSDEMWTCMLEMTRTLADGFFLFAYSVLEEQVEPGSTTNIPNQSWYQILDQFMQENRQSCLSGTPIPKRLRHEEPCPCLCSETIDITLPNVADPIRLYQSTCDPCIYGAGQDCTTERAWYLEPTNFAGHIAGSSAESLVEVVFDPSNCSMTGEYVLNGSVQTTFGTGSLPPNTGTNCWNNMSVDSTGSVTLS